MCKILHICSAGGQAWGGGGVTLRRGQSKEALIRCKHICGSVPVNTTRICVSIGPTVKSIKLIDTSWIKKPQKKLEETAELVPPAERCTATSHMFTWHTSKKKKEKNNECNMKPTEEVEEQVSTHNAEVRSPRQHCSSTGFKLFLSRCVTDSSSSSSKPQACLQFEV